MIGLVIMRGCEQITLEAPQRESRDVDGAFVDRRFAVVVNSQPGGVFLQQQPEAARVGGVAERLHRFALFLGHGFRTPNVVSARTGSADGW